MNEFNVSSGNHKSTDNDSGQSITGFDNDSLREDNLKRKNLIER